MKSVVFLFLVLNVIFAQLEFQTANSIFETLSSKLPAKYCPLRNFNGQLFCPESKADSYESGINAIELPDGVLALGNFSDVKQKVEQKEYSNLKDERIISGFGYDRVKRTVKFPVLSSTQPVAISKNEFDARKFTTANEFLGHVLAQKPTFENGLYTRDDQFLQNFAMLFGEYTVNIGVSQAYYGTHESSVASYNAVEEFEEVIAGLPAWDPNNPVSRNYYNNILHFWGTDVATQTTHGGVIYQQTAIKACYGGSITDDMIRDIDAAIKKIPPGNLAYLRYRRLGIFEARGGNPEFGMDRTAERIASFRSLPAPIKFNVVPLWQVVKDTTKREWLKQAIQKYIDEFMPNVNAIAARVQEEKARRFKGVQPVHYQVYNVEQNSNLVIYWQGCPIVKLKGHIYAPHCTLMRPSQNLAASQRVQVYNWPEQSYGVFFERDAATGFSRAISYHKGNVHRVSNWIQQGCTNILLPMTWYNRLFNVLYHSICMDCLPIIEQKPAQYNQRHTILGCTCPTF